jgi:hypothetical protein
MVIDCLIRPVSRHTHRVQVAGERLEEINTFFAAGLFDGTTADAVGVVTGENTVFAIDNGRENLAIPVNITDALPANDRLRPGREVIPKHRQQAAYIIKLHLLQWRSALAFDATGALTLRRVAAEKAFDQFQTD